MDLGLVGKYVKFLILHTKGCSRGFALPGQHGAVLGGQ